MKATSSFKHDVLTVAELARKLRVSEGFAYRLVREKKIPSLDLGGGLRRIPRAALEAMLKDTR